MESEQQPLQQYAEYKHHPSLTPPVNPESQWNIGTCMYFPNFPPLLATKEEINAKKPMLLRDSAMLQLSEDFLYFTQLSQQLLQEQEKLPQIEILTHITGFLRLESHTWNQPDQEQFCYAIWNKADLSLIAFSDSFCSMIDVPKEWIKDNPFYLYHSSVSRYKDMIIEIFSKRIVDLSIFYFQNTQLCRDKGFMNVRYYYIPNSLFIVSIMERVPYFSDHYVIDGFKTEPSFVIEDHRNPELIKQLIDRKLAKLHEIFSRYKALAQNQ